MSRTERQQNIEQVAGIIANWQTLGLDRSEHDPQYTIAGEAADINSAFGWTFDVRYDSHEYVSDNDYTLVEGAKLSAEDLAAAIATAEQWTKKATA